jgi:hypothetical protein
MNKINYFEWLKQSHFSKASMLKSFDLLTKQTLQS